MPTVVRFLHTLFTGMRVAVPHPHRYLDIWGE